jgi:predicted DCC family thiol-disulfide oxidoreductase YuxK
MSQRTEALVLFDGVCNLCSGVVRFVIRRDRRRRFRFAALQTTAAKQVLEHRGHTEQAFDSVVLLVDRKCYRKSQAILEILRRLDPPWPVFYALILVPQTVSDWLYDFIGRHRYQWFGRKSECWVPDQLFYDRFDD